MKTTQSERIVIRSGSLAGVLCRTPAARTLVIGCHGYKSSSNNPAIVAIAHELNINGFATFTFNFTGKNPVDIPRQVADIEAIIERFTGEYPDIILLANSFAAVSASIAARSKVVAGLITINGFFGTAQLGRRFLRNYMVFKLLSTISPRHRAIDRYHIREFQPGSIACRTLVIHSKLDAVVYIAQSRVFYAKLDCSKQFSELETTDHDLSRSHDIQEIVGRITEWMVAGQPSAR